jgi:hypothetical protein
MEMKIMSFFPERKKKKNNPSVIKIKMVPVMWNATIKPIVFHINIFQLSILLNRCCNWK